MNKELILVFVYSIILIVLLFLSMFFSSSDMVYGSVNLAKLEKISREKPNKKGNKLAYKLAKDYDQTISTILLCNDTVNAGLDTISTLVGVNIALIVFKDNPMVISLSEACGLVASLICLVFKITFGEIIAKSLGKIYNIKLSILYSKIINFLIYLFYPITILVSGFGKVVSKETKVDILVTPLVVILIGCSLSFLIAPGLGNLASYLGELINKATTLQPILMGIIVSALVGIALTLPISSAAICAALGLTGLAGGAALAGCCAQMVGFAVMSFKANRWAGIVSQGIGTSMLQMPNIVKKPVIWLPTILASMITGPIATTVFQLQMNGPAIASGMGTCGLVGPIGVVTGWLNDINSGLKDSITALDITGLILVVLVLPIILTLIFHFICLKLKLYTNDDLKLNL